MRLYKLCTHVQRACCAFPSISFKLQWWQSSAMNAHIFSFSPIFWVQLFYSSVVATITTIDFNVYFSFYSVFANFSPVFHDIIFIFISCVKRKNATTKPGNAYNWTTTNLLLNSTKETNKKRKKWTAKK